MLTKFRRNEEASGLCMCPRGRVMGRKRQKSVEHTHIQCPWKGKVRSRRVRKEPAIIQDRVDHIARRTRKCI